MSLEKDLFGMSNGKRHIQFNSIQNSLYSTQHIVHTTMFFYTYDVLKRERAEDSAYVGSFPNFTLVELFCHWRLVLSCLVLSYVLASTP